MQAIVVSFEASHSLEALRNSLNITSECPICCTRFTNPTTTPCGHTFCRNCLVRSLDHQRSCPFCRDSLDFCPPPTTVLTEILTKLYEQDDESMDVHVANDFDASDTRVPLLIGSLSFPHINCVIHIFEPRYRLMLRRIMASSRRRFAMCLARRKRTSQDQSPFFEYGTILELMHVQTLPDGRSIVQAVGSHRFKVLHFELIDGYHMADIERIDDIDREQEHLLEQQQILKASAMRARQHQQQLQSMQQQQQQQQQPMSPVATAPMAARPMAAAARPMAARPMAAAAPHPQTQAPASRAPWLQMHVRGLSAARPKAHLQPQQASANTTLQAPEKAEKNRQEQSTDELLDELATFVDKLLLHRQQQQGGMANWLSALGDPPVLRGAQRDRVILSWWIVNMMPLGEEEKLPLLGMRTVRERVLLIVSWVDKFHDQWSLFLNNPNASGSLNTCCIS
ncbi:CrgA protein [Mucor mucedo]|uniref:CrgA protein n=1 Tax=Mucor mucedo TaxID=29922 RepID=UPI00221FDCB9|nr:CrgA protein [Mucor mucedo]KAI7896888.1 CrgA protein [Mucor mucedo]